MKRITVAITVADDYAYSSKYRAVRAAMVNAAVAKATVETLLKRRVLRVFRSVLAELESPTTTTN